MPFYYGNGKRRLGADAALPSGTPPPPETVSAPLTSTGTFYLKPGMESTLAAKYAAMWSAQQAAATASNAESPADPETVRTQATMPTLPYAPRPTVMLPGSRPSAGSIPKNYENPYPIEEVGGPMTPTDVPVPNQPPNGSTNPTAHRGLYTPSTNLPSGLPSGEMVAGGDNRAMFDAIMQKLQDCCCCEGDGEDENVYKPGIEADGCEETPIGDRNQLPGRATVAIKAYTEIAAVNPAAAEQWLERSTSGEAAMGAGGFNAAVRGYVSGSLIEWALARNWGLCWPLHARYVRPASRSGEYGGRGAGPLNMNAAGGLYYDGARLAVASLLPVRVLSEMAYELAQAMGVADEPSGPSGAFAPAAGGMASVPVWPAGGVGWRSPSEDLKNSLTLANNIIANYLTTMRALEARVMRARDTARIAASRANDGAPSEPGLGHCDLWRRRGYGTTFHLGTYRRGLGRYSTLAGEPPRSRSRRVDALFFALYYLARFPAIFNMVPSNPSTASEIATEVNRRLGELVSYMRGLREELRQLTIAINESEQGIAGTIPPQTPTLPGGIPDGPPVDPNAPISALPNPYEVTALPDAPGTSSGGGMPSGVTGGQGQDAQPPSAPPSSVGRGGLLALALAAGVAIASKRK